MPKTYATFTLILSVTFALSPAVTSPFTGFRDDQLPIPQIDPPIQPAGYAFSIWGLIYLWLIVSAVYGLWKRGDDQAWDRARKPLIISRAVGTPWLAVANASAVWATILIFVMAFTAIAALWRAPRYDRAWFAVPMGIYAGWLTAASFVSLANVLAGFGLLTDAQGWAYAGIVAALSVAIAVLLARQSVAYGATMIWALVAIIAANGFDSVGILSAVGIGLIILTMTARQITAPKAIS